MISIKTWSPKADIPVRLKIEDGTGWFLELDVNTTVEGQWEILTWDFTGQTAGVDVNKVVVFFEFIEFKTGSLESSAIQSEYSKTFENESNKVNCET